MDTENTDAGSSDEMRIVVHKGRVTMLSDPSVRTALRYS